MLYLHSCSLACLFCLTPHLLGMFTPSSSPNGRLSLPLSLVVWFRLRRPKVSSISATNTVSASSQRYTYNPPDTAVFPLLSLSRKLDLLPSSSLLLRIVSLHTANHPTYHTVPCSARAVQPDGKKQLGCWAKGRREGWLLTLAAHGAPLTLREHRDDAFVGRQVWTESFASTCTRPGVCPSPPPPPLPPSLPPSWVHTGCQCHLIQRLFDLFPALSVPCLGSLMVSVKRLSACSAR
jgi:hypothetical protein